GTACYLARLGRATLPPPARYRPKPADDSSYRLEVDAAGSVDSLHLVAFERRSPGPQEVEIAVEAAGLNFRDVLLATGVVPPIGAADRIRLGFECAGTITRIGSN